MDICDQHIRLCEDIAVVKTKVTNIDDKFSKVIEEISKVNERCLIHLSNNNVMKNDIVEIKRQKSLLSNRGFQVTMFITACVWAVLFYFMQNVINGKFNAELKRIDSDIRADRQ